MKPPSGSRIQRCLSAPSDHVPGDAGASVLAVRMASRDPQVQMPPLGSQVPDAQGLALVQRWINHPVPSHLKERLP